MDELNKGEILLCSIVVLGKSSPCMIPAAAELTFEKLVGLAIKGTLTLSEKLYEETFGIKNEEFFKGLHDSVYENVITINGNLQTTFAATQQLKTMLGDISEGLDEVRKAQEKSEKR